MIDALGVNPSMKIILASQHKGYIGYHRDTVFKV